jgi:hypothetical protein
MNRTHKNVFPRGSPPAENARALPDMNLIIEPPSAHPVVHVAGVRNCTICNGLASSDTFSHIRHNGSVVSICSPQCMTKFQRARNRYAGGCILPS